MHQTNALKVTSISGRGRAYCSTRPITKGTIVLTSEPIATIVSQEWLPETCLWCFHCSYPRRNKVKAALARHSNKRKLPFDGAGFCSEACKNLAINNHCGEEWTTIVNAYLAIEDEYRLREQYEGLATPATSEVDANDYFGGNVTYEGQQTESSIDLADELQAEGWLDTFWDMAVNNPAFIASKNTTLPDTYKADMCKLIASCLIRKHYSEAADNDNPHIQSYNSLMQMQCNETSRFQSLYRKLKNADESANPMKIPAYAAHDFDTASQYIPEEIFVDIQLYLFFASAFDKSKTQLEWVYDHRLFRQVLYREMSNSFGIWDPPEGSEPELLGWALHPVAVFFNHSCAPNIRKLRQGRNMVFIADQDIEEGQELCIAYGSVEEGVQERRSRLLEHYSFWCQCTRCCQEST
ncbi:hypothetical protein VKS41_000313 [Umbelopsis sp. WA50703]